MLRETILQLSKAAEARKPALLVKIAQTLPPGMAPIGTREDSRKALEQRQFADKAQKQLQGMLGTPADRSYDDVENIRNTSSRERVNQANLEAAQARVNADNAGARLKAREIDTRNNPSVSSSMTDSAAMTGAGLREGGEPWTGNTGSYGKAIGYGAGAGALAGIPIALLARALFSQDEEDSDLPSYLMTALKGALIGGGVGGLAGAGLRGAYGTEGGKNTIDKGLGYLPDSARTSAQNVLG